MKKACPILVVWLAARMINGMNKQVNKLSNRTADKLEVSLLSTHRFPQLHSHLFRNTTGHGHSCDPSRLCNRNRAIFTKTVVIEKLRELCGVQLRGATRTHIRRQHACVSEKLSQVSTHNSALKF
eukprot:1196190-Prorocentrum_minimum.AAC.3